jgi:hypothetical protein
MFGSFLPSLGLVGTTKFTQVDGADIVMKSILWITPQKLQVRIVIFFQLDFSLRQEEVFFLFDLGRSTQEDGAPIR